MPLTDDEVLTRYIVDVEQAVAATKRYADAQRAAEKATEAVTVPLGNELPAAAGKAAKGVDSLGTSIRKWAREDAGETRAARYAVREFLSFVPATGQARAGIESLGAALIGGSLFGAGLQAASFAIGLVTAELEKTAEATRKAEAEVAKFIDSAHGRVKGLQEDLLRVQFGDAGVAKARHDAELKALDEQIAKARELYEQREDLKSLSLEVTGTVLSSESEREALQALIDKRGELMRSYEREVELRRQIQEVRDRPMFGPPEAPKPTAGDRAAGAAVAKAATPAEFGPGSDAGIFQWQQAHTKAVEALAAHEREVALQRRVDREGEMAVELAQVEQKYSALLDAAQIAGADEAALLEEKETALAAVRQRHRDEELELERQKEEAKAALRADAVEKAISLAVREMRTVASTFLIGWQRTWSQAGLVNRKYDAEYQKLSLERREAELLELGIVNTTYEAHAMAKEEAEAAAMEAAAAQKQAIADRLAAQAIEWALQAAVMAVPWTPAYNPVGAAVYAAAAAAAGGAAASFHSQAKASQQNRGYTRDERDTLNRLGEEAGGGSSSGAGTGSSSSSSGGGATVPGPQIIRETIVLVADPFETAAEAAQRAARRVRLAQDLDMLRRVVS